MTIVFDSWLPILTIIAAAFAPTFTAIYTGHRSDKAAAMAASKAEDVKTALQVSNLHTSNKLDEVHSLVNSQLAMAMSRIDEANKTIERLENIITGLSKAMYSHNGWKPDEVT